MNLALDRYAENPIIDELVFWPPRAQKIIKVRAGSSMFRKPFIEVTLQHGEVFQRHFARDNFAGFWAEAVVILDTITTIESSAEFDFHPLADRDRLAREVLATRDECIAESNLMFAEGMYHQFVLQYGPDCKNLPADAEAKIACARRHLNTRD